MGDTGLEPVTPSVSWEKGLRFENWSPRLTDQYVTRRSEFTEGRRTLQPVAVHCESWWCATRKVVRKVVRFSGLQSHRKFIGHDVCRGKTRIEDIMDRKDCSDAFRRAMRDFTAPAAR